jgi:hypothetical protein
MATQLDIRGVNPDDGIRVEPVNKMLPGEFVDSEMDTFAVRIHNDTDTDVMGLILKWKVIDKMGGPVVLNSIRYNNNDTPRLAAHSHSVFGYGGLFRWVDTNKPGEVTIGAALFADGKIIGPNTFGLDRYVQMKAKMVHRLSNDLLSMRGTREGEIPGYLTKFMEPRAFDQNVQPGVAECPCHWNDAARLFGRSLQRLQGEALWKALEENLARIHDMERRGTIPRLKEDNENDVGSGPCGCQRMPRFFR